MVKWETQMRFRKVLFELIENYILLDIIEYIVAFIILISIGVSVYLVFSQSLAYAINIFLSIFFPLVIVLLIFKLVKFMKISASRLSYFYTNLNRAFEEVKRSLFLNKIRYQSGILSKSELENESQVNLQEIIDCLAEILTASSGRIVRTCVKNFDFTHQESQPIDLRDATVYTLVRSSNTQQERVIDDKPTKVKENTASLAIVQRNLSHFACSNLQTYRRNFKQDDMIIPQYTNARNDWKKYYIATIVVPIRLGIESNDVVEYNLLGFLCADSLSKAAFQKKELRYYTNLMQAFADILYIYLDDYFYYRATMSDKNERKQR